jgi:hypothetical protein
MDNSKKLSQVTLSFLEDVGQGVFAPEKLEIWGGEDKNNLKKLGSIESVVPNEVRPGAKFILKVDFPPQSLRFVRLNAKNFKTLPAGHPLQKTDKAAIFIDEVSIE